ncbi:hypothetical protein D3C87_1618810 [compost metagenome]
MMAAANPKGISCRCQASMPPTGCVWGKRPYSHSAQTATARLANPAPARKNGRKPTLKSAAAPSLRIKPPPGAGLGSGDIYEGC